MAAACYLHVPFCRHICAYCDFTRCVYHEELAQKWLRAVKAEIEEKLTHPLTTMYLGGGTPSALSYAQLEELLQALFPYTAGCREFTMEANIDSLTEEKIRLCRCYGVDRISLGVQSLQPHLLQRMERTHTKEEVFAKIAQVRAGGISNISVDLIYGLPQQTLDMWKQDLRELLAHAPISHISLYALTIEEHSKFGRSGVKNIEAQLEEDMYEYAQTYLEEQGFLQYEISNFAKAGMQSQHNRMYWTYEDFYGIGCGASGKEQHVRYDNTGNLHTYLTKGSSSHYISLTKKEEMFEMVMMNLRLKEGMSLKVFEQRFREDFSTVYADALNEQVQKGMLKVEDGYVRATKRGYPLLHDILIAFMED